MSLRPGSDAAQRVFKDGTSADFGVLLEQYSETVLAVGRKKSIEDELKSLNEWWIDELPTLLELELKQLSKLTRFKLTRGKMRPLQKLVDSNNAGEVSRVSVRAFNLLRTGDWEAGLLALAELKGVGIATSSFAACAVRPDLCPAMADEAIEGVGLARDYSLSTYEKLRRALIAKAKALDGPQKWNAEQVGRALWVAATRAALRLDEKGDREKENKRRRL